MLNLNEATQQIKRAGAANVRVLPMPGQNVNTGDYQIEINDSGWRPVVSGLKKDIAESIVEKALNRVICG